MPSSVHCMGVIPGRPKRPNPESISHESCKPRTEICSRYACGYRFRARGLEPRPGMTHERAFPATRSRPGFAQESGWRVANSEWTRHLLYSQFAIRTTTKKGGGTPKGASNHVRPLFLFPPPLWGRVGRGVGSGSCGFRRCTRRNKPNTYLAGAPEAPAPVTPSKTPAPSRGSAPGRRPSLPAP